MTVKSLRDQLPLLKALSRVRRKEDRRKILRVGGEKLASCLCECCHNVLQGNIRMSVAERKKLKRHAKSIRTLGDPRVNLRNKKKLLNQKGGFLPALLAPILSTAVGLIGGLLNR